MWLLSSLIIKATKWKPPRLAQQFLALELALQLRKILQLHKLDSYNYYTSTWKTPKVLLCNFFVGIEDQLYLVAYFIVYLVTISSALFLPLLSRLTSFLIWGSIVAVDLYFEGFYYSYVVLAFFLLLGTWNDHCGIHSVSISNI